MEAHKLGLSILAVISVFALTGLVLLYKDAATLAVYEQPSGNKPVFLHTSKYLEGFNLCHQFLCTYPSDDFFYGETEKAQQVGIDELTGNLRCGCSDGHEFQIRPDRIMEGTYG